MTYFQVLFLSLIQSLTEFLPISSSGHLVFFQKLFDLKPPVLFDILVHVGTLGAVLFFFKDRLVQILKGLARREKEAIRLVQLIVIGSIPVAVVGFLAEPYIEVVFNSLKLLGLSFLLTAILLFSARLKRKNQQFNKLNRFSAFLIGVFQALAILPGVSRSGATISIALWQELDQETAFEFSFLLAIPAIIGALILEIPVLINSSADSLFQGILGMFIAGAIGYFSLKVLKQILLGKKFWLFSLYCFGLGLIILKLS